MPETWPAVWNSSSLVACIAMRPDYGSDLVQMMMGPMGPMPMGMQVHTDSCLCPGGAARCSAPHSCITGGIQLFQRFALKP